MNEQQNPPDGQQRKTRSLTTDLAIVAGPTLAVGAKFALDHLTNRPEKQEPQQVELPPGVERD